MLLKKKNEPDIIYPAHVSQRREEKLENLVNLISRKYNFYNNGENKERKSKYGNIASLLSGRSKSKGTEAKGNGAADGGIPGINREAA